ncbi:MAG TPA: hypothetical protein PLD23_07510, partial [Armatimonadota bacterium]|nr:hypothetical protein [Armatimonadota bacterium]
VFADAAWLFAPNDRGLMAGERRPFTLEPSLDPETQRVQRRIVASARDRFLGFYGLKLGPGGPLNEWGDGLIRMDMRDWFGGPIRDRYEGLERLRQRYEELADTTPVKRAVMALDGYRFFHHHAFAWGASSVVAEIGENIPCTNLQIAFTRGAGRESGKPWGIDLSSWFAGTVTDYSYVPEVLEADAAMFSGHSPMLHKRFCYATWLAGANMLWFENYRLLVMRESALRQLAGFETSGQPEKWRLSPVGEMAERLFRLDREKDRGTPYTPVAVILDFAHGWSPRGCAPHRIWGRLPLSDGDRMMDHFFNLVYPWHEPGTGWEPEDAGLGLEKLERGYLTETPYGDIFDGLTTATCHTLGNYPVAILVGEVRIDGALAQRLDDYVRAGGTLVANARQVGSSLPTLLTGAALTGEVRRATEAICHLDGSTMRSAEFDYAVAEMHGARPVVTVPGSNDVLVSDHRVGAGHVVLTTPHYLLDSNQEPLGLMDHLLRHVTSGLVPVRVSPGVQWMVNRAADGWVVGLLNNRGAYKQPRGMPWIREEETAAVLVELDEPCVGADEWVAGTALDVRTDAHSTRVRLSVPSGDVRIVHLRTRREGHHSRMNPPGLRRGSGSRQALRLRRRGLWRVRRVYRWPSLAWSLRPAALGSRALGRPAPLAPLARRREVGPRGRYTDQKPLPLGTLEHQADPGAVGARELCRGRAHHGRELERDLRLICVRSWGEQLNGDRRWSHGTGHAQPAELAVGLSGSDLAPAEGLRGCEVAIPNHLDDPSGRRSSPARAPRTQGEEVANLVGEVGNKDDNHEADRQCDDGPFADPHPTHLPLRADGVTIRAAGCSCCLATTWGR